MSSDPIEAPREARSPAGRGLLFAGVAAACVLGVAAGMWARPAANERHAAIRAHGTAATAARSKNALQIVVDERPAPLGQPLEVMPAASAPLAGDGAAPPAEFVLEEVTPLPAVPAAEMAPRPAPNGLVRVQAISPPAAEPAPAPAPVKAAASKSAAKPAIQAKAAPAKTQPPALKRVADTPRPKAEPARPKSVPTAARPTAKVAARPAANPLKSSAPAAAKVRPDRNTAVARENAALRARLLKAEARLAKAERGARPKLAAAVKALKTSASPAKATPKPTRTRALPARPNRLLNARRERAPVARPPNEPRLQKIVARQPLPAPKPAPVKVAKAQARPQGRCASADAAQAMVCRDPALGAADRELGRAYRQAEAAGVPSWRLAQQQQRWAAARANAAREAPWAVRDVYQAQIAQLRDMSQRAQGEN